jgi:predicted phage terminase large subunit-like protein
VNLTAEVLMRLPAEERRALAELYAPRQPCGGWGPTYHASDKQAAFMAMGCREALYGGAAGGGKSDALLRAALMYVCVPGYSALLVRQTYPQLSMDGGLIERAQEWLQQTDARYDKVDHRWTFPSGATLSFMHMQRDDDRFKIQGAEFQYIGFDELTNWRNDKVYRFSAARLRRPNATGRDLPACPTCGLTLADVPLRIRAGTNPGSRGEAWVQSRFVQPWQDWQDGTGPQPRDRKFIPALLTDNPGLDAVEYEMSLGLLDDHTRAQLRDGQWGLKQGTMLHRERVPIVDDWPRDGMLVRSWDFAGTDPADADDPDYTVGALLCLKDGQWWLVNILRLRAEPGRVQQLFLQTLATDLADHGRIQTVVEQEPGSHSKFAISNLQRLGSGHSITGQPSMGSKSERALPLAAAIDNGNFHLVAAEWNTEWLDEADAFPSGAHDDQVDAVTGGMAYLTKPLKRGGLRYRP